ncbi:MULTISPECIES: YveK family protein [unclassified Sporosarcina]|uniref:YveK family protein n=1 Tax=unclassified Sporosarcina TaxID=2647733 RepID=UPI00203E4427|nr:MULTISPECIES: Wzz/FepE/Etk N-terminal domain-containing protein [unclassified Sporosarcina]GKV66236.1 capsular polysaccharide biosynthesis protein [Sporosarcina sp. NCCP-2331]GLB56272.1 capsular polysaccharide biosynthesis protein [Sporosarcina sp. NCCP-2378]
MEETISLQELFSTLKKRLGLIISSLVLAVVIAAVVSYFFLTPIYQASTQILVNQQEAETQAFNSQDIQTNLQLINTYNVIIKSPVILSKVIENLDLDITPAELNSQISVNSEQNSQVVNVTVQDPEFFRAVDIANTTAEVFQTEIVKLMKVDNVNILSPAINIENPSPVKPNPKLNIAIAAVIGLMIGVGIAFLLEYLDTTVKSEQDIEELLGLPILGLVSPIANKDVATSRSRRKKRGSKARVKKAHV